MTKTERLFFHFLRNGLWGDGSAPGVPVDAGDWEAVFRLSCRQAVSGIVADGIAATARRVVRLADGRIIEDREQEVDWL